MANLKNTVLTGSGALKIPAGKTGERPSTSRIVTQFTVTGTTTWTCPSNVTSIEILLVGGGGGGGGYVGGGGGAGGMVEKIIPVSPGTNYSVTVGAGGAGGNTSVDRQGKIGGNSSFVGGIHNLIALGGGGGGSYPANNGISGGSGGGAGATSASERPVGGSALQPISATGGYGNRGGAITLGGRTANDCEGRGGGGAGQPGMDGDTRNQSSGGDGRISRITGTAYWYAGGGGGGGYYTADQGDNLAGNGGRGGGGGGGSYANGVAGSGGTGGTANGGAGSTSGEGPGGNGGANTGGGGGGVGHNGQGGAGGSGIVVIAYYTDSSIGQIRYNSEIDGAEIFEHTGWKAVDSKLNWGSSNALTFSDDLTNGIWTKDNVTLTPGQSAPDGSLTAYRMVENTANTDHRIFQLPVIGAGGPGLYVMSIYVKYINRRYFILRHGGNGGYSTVYFDLLEGKITQEGLAAGGPNGGALGEIIPVNDGWYLLKSTLYYNANTTSDFVWAMTNVATGGTNPTYTGDGSSAVFIWRPEVATATDINANGYRTHIYRNLGSGQAFTPTFTGDIEILVVAGGGSGASTYGGIGNGPRGGGGAGGVVYSANYQVQAGRRYPITVGAGGAKVNGNNVNGNQGANSSFESIIALGGGFGGYYNAGLATAGSGGSGGGNAYNVNKTGYQPGAGNYGQGATNGAGGGGGAGGPGYASSESDNGNGNGGVGVPCAISGVLTYYGGGGGSGGYPQGRNCYGLGGRGGGGRGGQGYDQSSNIAGPQGGQVATGGGGGAGGAGAEGGAGGSGIVIVRYKAPTKCDIFYQSGIWTCPTGVTKIRLLVVAGGGGGGMDMGGGGGAGGLIYREDYPVEAGQTYSVTVGAGGAGARGRHLVSERGQNGSNSSFGQSQTGNVITATGGGGGASLHDNSTLPAGSGGSGGGASGGAQSPSGGSGGAGGYGGSAAGTGIAGQGNNGSFGIYAWYPGGGGGAGTPGSTNPANGGTGRAFAIAGTMLYYAGGGGGSGYSGQGGNGGLGGGGAGALLEPVYGGGWSLNWGQYGHGGRTGWQVGYTGSNAGNNTGGGGGGGSHYNNANEGGNGGNGVVVVAWD